MFCGQALNASLPQSEPSALVIVEREKEEGSDPGANCWRAEVNGLVQAIKLASLSRDMR